MDRPLLIILDPVKAPGTSFVRPLLRALEAHYRVRLHEHAAADLVAPALAEADILWIDWATEHAVCASELNRTARRPLLVRLHSYEALDTDCVERIDWTGVSVCVAVSRTILDIARGRSARMTQCRVQVIENGIDLERFRPEWSRLCNPSDIRIAWVGDLAPKKDPALALRILADYLRSGRTATLHFAGPWKSLRVRLHLQDLVTRLNLHDVVHFAGNVDDMPGWLADKDVLLSTSMFESFGYAIGEALAAGLDAVILSYPGAEHAWPADVLVNTSAEAVERLGRVQKFRWIGYVSRRYTLAAQAERMLSELASIQLPAARAGA